jgi:alpha-L-rhamnosidase
VIVAVLVIPFLYCISKKKANVVELEPTASIYWIGDEKKPFADDSLFYGDDPAPMFRKEIQVKEKLESATLFITAAGYYKATINGKRVGTELPGSRVDRYK